MKTTLIFLILTSTTKANDFSLEECLPKEVAIVFHVENLKNHAGLLLDTSLVQTLAEIHAEEKPQETSLFIKLQEFLKNPLWSIIGKELVVGIIPPIEKGLRPTFIIVARGGDNLAQDIETIWEKEKEKSKLYVVKEEESNAGKRVTSLHPEKGRLEERYTLLGEGILIHSNSSEQLEQSLNRYTGEKDRGELSLPSLYYEKTYEKTKAIGKLWIDVPKLNIKLDKKHPLQEKIPFLAHTLKQLRQRVQETQGIFVCLENKNGLELSLRRFFPSEGQSLLPQVSLGENAPSIDRLLVLNQKIPYPLLWKIVETRAKKKNPREWRKVKSRLNEFFNWQSFEEDILPKLGQSAIFVNKGKPTSGDTPSLPQVLFLMETKEELNLGDAMERFLELLAKKGRFSRQIYQEEQDVLGTTLHSFQLKRGPLSHLIKPCYGQFKQIFALASDSKILKETIENWKTGQKTSSLYLYADFSNIREFIEMNIPFLKKEAQRKGKPFKEGKLQNLLKILAHFQDLSLKGEKQSGMDLIRLKLK